MNYKNSEKEITENERLSADEAKIRALLGDLKRVGAPADFDFRVRAQIARAQPSRRRPSSFLPVLRYVLPLALVIFVSALGVLNSNYFADGQSGASIVENRIQNPTAENGAATSDAANERRAEEIASPPDAAQTANVSNPANVKEKNKTASENSTLVAAESGRKPKPKTSSGENAKESGGAFESSFSPTNVITPPGISANRTIQTLPNVGGGKSLTVREVLAQLGIEAAFANDGWLVKSVAANSLAERSGVRAGDAVEAIDGERLTDKPLKSKAVAGKNLRIARGAEKKEISLVNKAN